MVSIYSIFAKENIHINDDYSSPILPHVLTNMSIRVGDGIENGFITTIGVCDGKAQSITNKQFFYVPEIYRGGTDPIYAKNLLSAYESILQTAKEEIEIIPTPVFYCLDFESVQGTGHSYDFFFYLLYYYKLFNIPYPFLVAKTNQPYINRVYDLLEKYYNVTFIRIETNKTYFCKSVICVRTYLNLYLPVVKEFINNTLIAPILEKFKDKCVYPIVAKLKIAPKSKVVRQSTIFEETEKFTKFCKEKNIKLLDESFSEEEKIFYLNKATTIILCWGSIYYINIDYYLQDTNDKFISVLFHKGIMPERRFLTQNPLTGIIYQSTVNSSYENIYNTMKFKGEIIENMESLNEFVEQTVLKDIV